MAALPKNSERSSPRPRIETLSDLVFGLALSIGALSLFSTRPSNTIEVLSDIIGFAFSFLILIFVWMRYTTIMSVLPIETGTTMFLNTVMLFLVSLEPYLFNLISLFGHITNSELVNNASILYALDMAGLMTVLAFFTHELTIEEKNLVPPESLSKYKGIRNSMFIWAGLFLITVLPQFWSWRVQDIPLRFYLWFVPLAAYWLIRTHESPPKPNQTSRKQ